MRLSVLTFLATAAVGFAAPAFSAPVDLGRLQAGTPPGIVQIDKRCGPHGHFVPRHHNHAGHVVRGRCVADHPDHH